MSSVKDFNESVKKSSNLRETPDVFFLKSLQYLFLTIFFRITLRIWSPSEQISQEISDTSPFIFPNTLQDIDVSSASLCNIQ